MIVTKTRLKRFKEVIVVKVSLKLSCYSPFQKFSDEWEIGNGMVVIWIIRIQTRFLKSWSDRSSFERYRDSGSMYRGINYGCYDGYNINNLLIFPDLF